MKMRLLTCVIATAITLGLPAAAAANVHAYQVADIDGNTVDLSQYKGKVLLIVNTASRCGYTPQYKDLEALYQKYKARGFEVLAFPANNFKGQEPGSNEEIKDFCFLTYKTSFPLFAKSSVKGEDKSPLYQYLTEASAFKGEVTWNFNKFLINEKGDVIARYDAPVNPMDETVLRDVETALNEAAAN